MCKPVSWPALTPNSCLVAFIAGPLTVKRVWAIRAKISHFVALHIGHLSGGRVGCVYKRRRLVNGGQLSGHRVPGAIMKLKGSSTPS